LFRRVAVHCSREDVNSFAEYVGELPQWEFHCNLQHLHERHRKLTIDAPNEHGKSTQAAVIRPAFDIGRNHNTMAIVVGATDNIPNRSVRLVREMIQNNTRYHEVFPDTEVVKASDNSFFVRRTSAYIRDPTMFGVGVFGDMQGTRSNLIITDDLLNPKIVTSQALMDQVWFVITSVLLHRLTARGRWWDIGTPWFVDDPRDRLRQLGGWYYEKFDAEDMLWPEPFEDDAGNLWGWPKERLEDKRRTTPPTEYNRCFRCQRMSDTMRIFKDLDIERCLNEGRGRKLGRPAPLAIPTTTGVDLGTYRTEARRLEVVDTDLTVLTTGFYAGERYEVLDIRSGRWETSDILNQMRIVLRKYPLHDAFWVEDNGAQIFLLQSATPAMLRGLGWSEQEIRALRILGFTTTMNKHDPLVGVRALELDMALGRVVLPCDENGVPDEEVKKLTDGLAAYRPNPSIHTSDHVMSFWLARKAAEWSAVTMAGGGNRDDEQRRALSGRYGIG